MLNKNCKTLYQLPSTLYSLPSTNKIALKHSTYVQINRPIQEVWDFFSDISKMEQWLEGFERSEHLSGELGEPDSTYKQYYTGPAGREVIFKERVLERVAPKRFSSLMRNNMLEMTVTTKLYEKGEKTEVISEVDVTFTNMVFRMFKSILKQEITGRQDRNFKKLKEILEAES